jgi:hypothetical protein
MALSHVPGVAVAVSEQTGRVDTVIVRGCTCEHDLISVTLTVKLAIPLVVGVPEITPPVLMLIPTGMVPRTEYV